MNLKFLQIVILFAVMLPSALAICEAETNAARRANRKPPMIYDRRIESVAKKHSDLQLSKRAMKHGFPGEADLGPRLDKAGYKWGGLSENVADVGGNCQQAMAAWMKSPGHRANILGDYKNFGCGQSGKYWTCNFASPMQQQRG